MPVKVYTELVVLSQEDFAAIAYKVMNEAFYIHRQLGPLFDEKIFQCALAVRIPEMEQEVQIDVEFKEFRKSYYMDAVVSSSAVFELKAVERLTSDHRGQLLNYLYLTGTSHGKLINFRTPHVQHEFINAPLSYEERTQFLIDDSQWVLTNGFGKHEKFLVIELVQDWGTGLSRGLYEECLDSVLGCSRFEPNVDVYMDSSVIASQRVVRCDSRVALKITTFDHSCLGYLCTLLQFLQ